MTRVVKGAQHHTDLCKHCGARRGEVRSRQKAMHDKRNPGRHYVQPLTCTRQDGRENHFYITRDMKNAT